MYAFRPHLPSNTVMKLARTSLLPLALAACNAMCVPARTASAQMHKVEKADQVTRAVGVYEYVGDLNKPRAARLIPVSLFINGHFEDAGIYLARPVPFALDSGLRYELQHGGVPQNYLDLVASRDFAGSSAAAAQAFDDGWYGYGRVVPLQTAKAGKLKPNCAQAYVVGETETAKKDDGKPHFGSKPADAPKPAHGEPAPDPCRDTADDDKPQKIVLADDTRGKDAADPERPTLHRSPESSAHNTGDRGKPDKKAPKPPDAVVTQNSSPGDDPDRPRIRHRDTDEDDPNNLPPDPIDLSAKETAQAAAAAPTHAGSPATATAQSRNDTLTADATIHSGDTMSGGPVLRRGTISAPPKDAPPTSKPLPATTTPTIAPALDSVVAVSDPKDRPQHDFTYRFASGTERAAAASRMEELAQAVLADPTLATDAPDVRPTATAPVPVPKAPSRTTARTTGAHSPAVRNRTKTVPPAAPVLLDEQMTAYQLYFSAPISYVLTARIAATATQPERYVTVVATTDAEGKINPALRSVTDATHLDRTPRYRLIDVVDADGSNRASLLMELRAQHNRQFALYRLLGNKPDQVFVSGSTLL